jgi:hypothetical protein
MSQLVVGQLEFSSLHEWITTLLVNRLELLKSFRRMCVCGKSIVVGPRTLWKHFFCPWYHSRMWQWGLIYPSQLIGLKKRIHSGSSSSWDSKMKISVRHKFEVPEVLSVFEYLKGDPLLWWDGIIINVGIRALLSHIVLFIVVLFVKEEVVQIDHRP